jgi:hypothetical protein
MRPIDETLFRNFLFALRRALQAHAFKWSRLNHAEAVFKDEIVTVGWLTRGLE